MEPPGMIRAVVLENVPSPALYAFPTTNATKKLIKRVRKEVNAPPANPQTLQQIVIPERYCQYIRNENDPPDTFLLADSGIFQLEGSDHRILIFGRLSWWRSFSGQMLEIYMDGTFKLAPAPFTQIYAIMARRGNWIFPVAQILMSGQNEELYTRMFTMIKEFASDFAPTSFSIDFELAVILSICSEFPNAQIRGCYFHLAQNFRKHLSKRGLLQEYQNDAQFATTARMITAIAFVPPQHVPRAVQVMEQLTQGTPLEHILRWFMKYYTGNLRANGTLTDSRFPIEMWNLYQRTISGEHRTNNAAEAAHRRLQALFGCSHPTIWRFIETLWKEQKNRDTDYAHFVAGEDPPLKLKKYRDLDTRILNILDRFNPLNMEEFLRGMANCNQMGE